MSFFTFSINMPLTVTVNRRLLLSIPVIVVRALKQLMEYLNSCLKVGANFFTEYSSTIGTPMHE